MKTQIGGQRLGSGNKMEVELKNFERSTHDLSKTIRTTMAPGVLVPCYMEYMLPGDTFDMRFIPDIQTKSTYGPLFGSFKYQIDVFTVPLKKYLPELIINKLNIGRQMNKVELPKMKLRGKIIEKGDNLATAQVNPSSLMAYQGVRGIGTSDISNKYFERWFNATKVLAYWDAHKQYYSNKQEETAFVIHNTLTPFNGEIIEGATAWYNVIVGSANVNIELAITDVKNEEPEFPTNVGIIPNTRVEIRVLRANNNHIFSEKELECIWLWYGSEMIQATEIFNKIDIIPQDGDEENETVLMFSEPKETGIFRQIGNLWLDTEIDDINDIEPQLYGFPLDNIDKMNEQILANAVNNGTAFEIDSDTIAPYGLQLKSAIQGAKRFYSLRSTMEGLAVKTYQSDIYNNYLDSEAISGTNGVNEVTKVGVDQNGFYINELNLKNKVYELLNAVNMDGGDYGSWIKTVYSHDANINDMSVKYEGGLSKEIAFQEVVSTAGTDDEPLGSLAGRGAFTGKHKGGHVRVKVDEISIVMAICSITPRINYSQGNHWDSDLKSIDDFHKPQLDQIGFQDLITEQMAYWETNVDNDGVVDKRSIGKQPSWVHYQTAVDELYGDFAIPEKEGFMALGRGYEMEIVGGVARATDLTTYIDPAKYNYIFADTKRSAMNFRMNLRIENTARRKMSARIMPNM